MQGLIKATLNFRHAGLDPASRFSLDSGFRRNDKTYPWLEQGLEMSE